ncbi:serine/arginine repetitive matrix protein 2 isoform X2 [Zootoca vivipara]|uniref:serine/arginine repetitive matrix protein 2 isoform X2 n=1 Tax=Zootoca vivipara TaxID=8524 RepID=UPI00293BDB29|nr:serine/arginine repetitive matrix protein 2 isoform X2 [Zootoca vivipara]
MVKSKKKKNQQNNGYCQDYRWGPGGNMPPWMGGPCPDDKWGPRWMGGPCPDDMWGPGEDMPPWMGGPCPDDMWGPRRDMPPWTEGPCPDDMRGLGGNMPPWMRDPCLDETGGPGGDMPPWTEGPCPDDMRGPGRNIPPWMRDPCLDETGGPGGDMPPWTGGPCPDDTGGPGGNMSPWMRDPCPDDMWQLRKRRKYMQPNMRGPCPNMGDPRENMYPGPNAPDQRQCRTFGGPGKYLSGKEQPMENGRENGPSPPGNCSSDQPASLNLFDKNNFKKRKDQPTSRNAAESAANTQKHYRMLTEEGAARILSNFGLSTEDLVEFGHYSDDQLKPENMAMILRDIVERKKARQLPTSSQGKEEETSGRHGGSDSLMKRPVLPSATQPTTTPAASFMPQSSVSPSPSMMKDYHAVSPTILPHVCSLCKIECANMTDWNLHVGTTAHSEKCAQLRQQHPDWNPEDCSLLQRHEGDKKEKHIAMPCSTSSNSNASQHSVPGHASSQTRSRSRSPDPHSRKRSRSRSSERSRRKRSRSRSSERSRRKRSRSRSSERSRRKQLQSRIPRCRSKSSERPSSSSQSSSIQKRELGRSTRSPASSAEAGSSRQPPAKSDVAEQPPNTSDAQKVKRLPTLSMINDYYAASPKIFPHVCSLCNVECRHLKDWNLHVGTTAHSEKRVQLRQQYPDWNPEDCSLLQRHEGAKKEKHIAMPCSTSSNSNASQHSVPGHASSQTRSRSRSSERSRRKRSRSRSSERSRRKRSRSRSSERSRRKRSRYRSPRCRSLSSKRPSSPSSSSQISSTRRRELGRSTRSPASSAKAGSSRQPPAKSGVGEQPPNKSEHPLQTNPGHQKLPKKEGATLEQGDRQPPAKSGVGEQAPNKSDAQKLKRLPTLSMINDYYAASPRIFPHMCSLCNIECRHLMGWNLHVSTTAHSEKCAQLRQQHPDWNPEDCSLLQRDEGDKKEKHIAMPCSTSSNLNASQHSVPGHASSQTRSQSRSPGPHSRKRSRSRSSERSRRKRSRSRSSERSRRKRSRSRSSERSRRKRSRSRSSERSRRKRSRSRSSERSRRKRSRSRSSERSRRKRSRSRSSERSRRKRSRSRSSERSRRIQSQYRSSQHCRRTQSQSRSSEGCRTQLRSRIPRCRSSERPSSSSQSSSIQRRELGRSTRSPASSAKAGSSRQPPAKPDVGEQPPNKSEHPLQTNPGHQKLPKKEGATLEQGDRQPPAKSGVGEQPPNKSEHPLQTNPDHQKLPKKEAATQEQGDQQREDLLHLVLTPLAEQSVMQALSVLQSGGVVGAGLAQGTSLPPLPPVQIDPASLSLVSMMQLVATQVVEAALASKETSSVQGRPSVAGSPQLSIPAESEEKKQEGSQEVVPGFVPSCSGLAAVRIWIVGHSIVHWASLRAMESGLGRHLGLPNYVSVSWMSRCGMRWDEFLPMVKAKVSCEGPPAAMVVQLGENDLALVHSFSLRLRMQNDLEELAAAHPGLKIFWSEFLQRRVWLGSRCPTAIERSRKRVDHAVGKKVVALGGSVIHHAGITLKDAGLYRPDGVNLSNAGNDVWLSNVSVELMGWLQMCWLQV